MVQSTEETYVMLLLSHKYMTRIRKKQEKHVIRNTITHFLAKKVGEKIDTNLMSVWWVWNYL